MLDPTGRMGLDLLLVTTTETRAGTEEHVSLCKQLNVETYSEMVDGPCISQIPQGPDKCIGHHQLN